MRRLQAFATIAVLFKSTTTAVKRNQAPFDDAWARCRDLETWRGAGGDHVTCAWVAAAPQSRCESKAVDGFSAIDACDCSCGNHEPAPRAGAVASADETWGPDAAAPAENFEDAEDAPSLLQKARKVPAGAVAIKSDLWDDEGQPPGRDCTGSNELKTKQYCTENAFGGDCTHEIVGACACDHCPDKKDFFPLDWFDDDHPVLLDEYTVFKSGKVNKDYDPYGVVGFAGWKEAGIAFGGHGGDSVDVETVDELRDALNRNGRLVIHVTKDLEFEDRIRCIECSDKTIEGHYHHLRFKQGNTDSMFTLHDCSNLIFRQLYLEHGRGSSSGQDIIYMSKSHHIVLLHCTFDYNGCETEGRQQELTCDESIHIAAPSTFITIQNCLFLNYLQDINVKHGSVSGNFGWDDRSLRVTFDSCYFKDGMSREPKIDAGWIHMNNNVWFETGDSRGWSSSAIRARAVQSSLGTSHPEILAEGSYSEMYRRPYNIDQDTDSPGVIAEAKCNIDDFGRNSIESSSKPIKKRKLSWCPPYAYYRMNPWDCREVTRIRVDAGAVEPKPTPQPVRQTPRPSPYPCLPLCYGDANDGEACLVRVPESRCPVGGMGDLPRCDAKLEVNDLCEGSGECGTRDDKDNCGGNKDVYEVLVKTGPTPGPSQEPTYRPTVGPTPPRPTGGPCPRLCDGTGTTPCLKPFGGDCPSRDDLLELPRCDSGLEEGDLCDADGECGTDDALDNCPGVWDIYELRSPPTPAPTYNPTVPRPTGEFVFPAGGVIVYRGKDANEWYCETDDAAQNVATACCTDDGSCFRSADDTDAGCLAGGKDDGRSFEAQTWEAAALSCRDAGGFLCDAPPPDDYDPDAREAPPNCRSAGCGYDDLYQWTALPCDGPPPSNTVRPTVRPTTAPPTAAPPPTARPTARPTTTRVDTDDPGDADMTWHKRGAPGQDCAWAAAHGPRCDAKSADGRKAFEACADVSCGACGACCADSTSWWYTEPHKTCAFVAERLDRCTSKYDAYGVAAIDACPLTCGACDATAKPTLEPCFDDASWYYSGSPWKTCAFVAQNPDRCKASHQDEDGVSALDACARTCERCFSYDSPDPTKAPTEQPTTTSPRPTSYEPTVEPTAEPAADPTVSPTDRPTATTTTNTPTKEPTTPKQPTPEPTREPTTKRPTKETTTPEPTPNCDGECCDSTSWRRNDNEGRDCGWVAERKDVRCDHAETRKKCPATCDACPTPAPTRACSDSPTGWVSSTGTTCQQYDQLLLCTADGGEGTGWRPSYGSIADYAMGGVDATDACCACGGGIATDAPLAQPTDCSDSTSWYHDVPENDCAWVQRMPATRCQEPNQDNIPAVEECLAACDNCPVEPPTTFQFPETGVMVYKGGDPEDCHCEQNPEASNVVPVCCREDSSCFRQPCLAGRTKDGTFVSLGWAEAARRCAEHGASLCFEPPPATQSPETSPNCEAAGCGYDREFVWTNVTCPKKDDFQFPMNGVVVYRGGDPSDRKCETDPKAKDRAFACCDGKNKCFRRLGGNNEGCLAGHGDSFASPTWAEAAAACRDAGAALCVEPPTAPYKKRRGPNCDGAGCGKYDKLYLWTNIECEESILPEAPKFPDEGVLVYKGSDPNDFKCVKDKNKAGIAPVCCFGNNACFRKFEGGECMADMALGAGMSWADTVAACRAEGATLCSKPPTSTDKRQGPNCAGAGCSGGGAYGWTNIPCPAA